MPAGIGRGGSVCHCSQRRGSVAVCASPCGCRTGRRAPTAGEGGAATMEWPDESADPRSLPTMRIDERSAGGDANPLGHDPAHATSQYCHRGRRDRGPHRRARPADLRLQGPGLRAGAAPRRSGRRPDRQPQRHARAQRHRPAGRARADRHAPGTRRRQTLADRRTDGRDPARRQHARPLRRGLLPGAPRRPARGAGRGRHRPRPGGDPARPCVPGAARRGRRACACSSPTGS